MPIIWKSDHWSLHHALISKSGQNAENSRILLFFKPFSGLTFWKCSYNYQMNCLNPNMIPHILTPLKYGMQLFHIFVILIIIFYFAVIWKGQRSSKWWFSVTFDLFWDDPITHGRENPTYVIYMHSIIQWRSYEVSRWGLSHSFWSLYGHFQIVSRKNSLKKAIFRIVLHFDHFY